MSFNRLLGTAVASTLVLLSQQSQAEISVGVTFPLSGPGASLGAPSRSGLPLWPQEIAGEKLKVVVVDDAGDPTTATKNARRFAEDKVDLLVGSVLTPSGLAIAQVANELQIPHLVAAPIEPPQGKDAWSFRFTMPQNYYVEGLVEHMKRSGVKSVGFLGLSDAFGEAHLEALNKFAPAAGIKVTAIERFTRADTSVTPQALRVVASSPDVILVAASGGGAALPQKALMERGFKGKIYHSAAAISPDFVRLAGKDAEGILAVSGPEQVPEQLPASHPAKKVALEFVERYEKANGADSRTQFAAHTYDIGLVLQKIIPIALKTAKPGTPEFRRALKDALESVGEVATTKGPLKYSATDHWGRGPSARVILTIKNGAWVLVP